MFSIDVKSYTIISELKTFPFSFLFYFPFIFLFLDLGLGVSVMSHMTITTVTHHNKKMSHIKSHNHMIYKRT